MDKRNKVFPTIVGIATIAGTIITLAVFLFGDALLEKIGLIGIEGKHTEASNEPEADFSLADALEKLDSKDYIEAISIYEQILECNPKDPVALCNLGCCYALGMGTEVNFDEAVKYYDQAIESGNSQSLRNELALYLETDTPLEQIDELIWSGIDAENPYICKFVTACLRDDESVAVDDAITFCKEVQEITADDLWDWQKGELVKLYSTPTSTNVLRYTKVSVGTETTETSAALYTIYQTEERYCPYVDLLQAGFDETV